MALLLVTMLLLTAVPAVSAAETSGSCGAGLTWSFADGRLTISGSGDMTDYTEDALPPWYSYRDRILWLTLPDGLTSVGDLAFYDCVNLTAVSIPNSVTDIGELAFCQNRSMTVLTLGSGLHSIGRSAFEQCDSLPDVRLPDSLTTVDSQAFYACGSLTYVTIPASVTRMGSSVFSYCYSLIRADVYAAMEVLPTWTFYGCNRLSSVYLSETMTDTATYAFYGCDSLNTVNMGGGTVDAEELKEKIDQDVPGFKRFGDVNNEESEGTGTVTDITVNENGGLTVTDTTVTQTNNTTVSTSTSNTRTENETKTEVDVTATVVTPEGWSEVVEQIQNAQKEMEKNTPEGTVNVTVFVGTDEKIPDNVLQEVAGTNVLLTIQTQSGSRFTVDASNLDLENVKAVELSYDISVVTDIPEEFAGAVTYRLSFNETSKIDAEVMIRLPGNHARSNASLYQKLSGLELVQTVVVDDEGYAHFYLGAVDNKTEYIIGIDVPGLQQEDAVIPPELLELLGVTDTIAEVEYVITGRQSSWGMNINQVTWIMIGSMTAVVVTVGFMMYLLNKRKLRMGYVPDLDEEFE